MFGGIYTALATPFQGEVPQLEALQAQVVRQLKAGVHGLVPCGTTGESATLSDAERLAIIQATLEVAAGRPVVPGLGTNNTAQSIRLVKKAQALGVAGALIITPYYNKPSQEGLYQHVAAIAAAAPDLPLMLYNVPSRTGVSFELETLKRLAELPSVQSIKEASADLAFGAELLRSLNLDLLSGDDASALPLWSLGAHGLVSVSSNLIPKKMVELWEMAQQGRWDEARALHLRLLPLFKGLFIESSPGPLKHLMAYSLTYPGALRLPLVSIRPENQRRLETLWDHLEFS